MSTIAIIGFGVMGRVAAERLIAGGHHVVVSDPATTAAETARSMSAKYAAAAKEAVADADIALLFLPGPSQIRSVVAGENGLVSAENKALIVVDHSTSDPETARNMAQLAEQSLGGWIDAPVLGRPSAVGNWSLPCGATKGALEICRPIFDCYARCVFDMGGPGNGHTVKLLNQMMFGAINAMTAEMMATSAKLGLAPGKLFEIITASQAGTVSNLFKELGGRIAEDNYANPTFSVRLLEKDVRLGLEMARSVGAEPYLGAIVANMNQTAIEKGFGDDDSSVMWKSLNDE